MPAASSGPPGRKPERVAPGPPQTTNSLLFGLAPDGVYRARPVTRPAGELLPHRFTLTADNRRWRSVFCGTFPGLPAGGRYPPSHPVEPGLSSRYPQFGTKHAPTKGNRRSPGPLRSAKSLHGKGQLASDHRAPPEKRLFERDTCWHRMVIWRPLADPEMLDSSCHRCTMTFDNY